MGCRQYFEHSMNTNIIYKYFPPERLNYLDDELLRITQPSDLNDPFECIQILPTVEQVIDLLNQILDKQIKEVVKSKLSKAQKKEKKNLLERTTKINITNIKKGNTNNLRD